MCPAGKPSLAARIEDEKSRSLPWKTLAKRAVAVVVAGIAIYLVLPVITEVLASWPHPPSSAWAVCWPCRPSPFPSSWRVPTLARAW